ncbi:hypothetical protein [Pseudarthrobacter sp. fls2-241-R2A-127]|nr:hypothetical protein [Pseudarthrobacter sp. fls2-241-R2A-127]
MAKHSSSRAASDEETFVEILRSLHPSPEQEKIIAEVEAEKTSSEREDQ